MYEQKKWRQVKWIYENSKVLLLIKIIYLIRNGNFISFSKLKSAVLSANHFYFVILSMTESKKKNKIKERKHKMICHAR